MINFLRYLGCFILGATVALSVSISSTENSFNASHYRNADYPLLADVIDTIETYYVDEIDRDQLVQAAIDGIFKKLDPYSGFLTHEDFQAINNSNRGEYFGFGFEIATDDGQITIITPFKNSPAEKAGIVASDKIVKFNNIKVDETNLQTILTDIRKHSLNNLPIELTLQHAGDTKQFELTLSPDVIHIESINSKIIQQSIGYIKLTNFQDNATEAILRQAHKWQQAPLTGLILDLRNNPGGLLEQAINIADLFLSQGKIVSTTGRFFDANEDYYASSSAIFNELPLVILINKGSASASEVLAAALKENNRATIIGETSFGKGTVQSLIPILNDGNAIKLTIAEYRTPKGNNIHTKGIVPDIEISISPITDDTNMSIIDSHKLKDNHIDSAIAWIEGRES
ncbi:S41 family peptidase [Shewanella gaetbuli]|uniref:S41 family peptidase n=1 Tax=Shewanella gaetbuli TaxID=220752 RepID=A0A9X1ZI00_9GAMM|nr:S41 family peptidase [Shewanella gaetbuli]MCL1142679.1 S41 family peptidase [Shewanella gaetbuli]